MKKINWTKTPTIAFRIFAIVTHISAMILLAHDKNYLAMIWCCTAMLWLVLHWVSENDTEEWCKVCEDWRTLCDEWMMEFKKLKVRCITLQSRDMAVFATVGEIADEMRRLGERHWMHDEGRNVRQFADRLDAAIKEFAKGDVK